MRSQMRSLSGQTAFRTAVKLFGKTASFVTAVKYKYLYCRLGDTLIFNTFFPHIQIPYKHCYIVFFLQVTSLLLDGVTGGVQDRIRADHRPQTHRMMLCMNLWSILYLAAGITTTTISQQTPQQTRYIITMFV